MHWKQAKPTSRSEAREEISIEAKIAQIISGYEVAFTAGTADGISVDDVATLYRHIPILDPDTEEPLGSIKRPVMRFKVFEVGERFSVGRSVDIIRTSSGDRPTIRRITSDPDQASSFTTYIEPGMMVEIEKDDIPF